eukprot:TRINITY_DN12046_c0_g1_i1.p1 TRINITY_DN12046_c0_g1~~TRINITY_DN12046_c0_g1_i1.p1  ORF type:complete len:1230 (+),score=202.88 TRINITY_DN12046_c0_g1_i1:43-3732(+)
MHPRCWIGVVALGFAGGAPVDFLQGAAGSRCCAQQHPSVRDLAECDEAAAALGFGALTPSNKVPSGGCLTEPSGCYVDTAVNALFFNECSNSPVYASNHLPLCQDGSVCGADCGQCTSNTETLPCPLDCRRYLQCTGGDSGSLQHCNDPLVWDVGLKLCNFYAPGKATYDPSCSMRTWAPDTPAPDTPAPGPAPSGSPTSGPTLPPTAAPSRWPSGSPSASPSTGPTAAPTATPSVAPSRAPTSGPTSSPTAAPSVPPSPAPTASPTGSPTAAPSVLPSAAPTVGPTAAPTTGPSSPPSAGPTAGPTAAPSAAPSGGPTGSPTSGPSVPPSASPSAGPTGRPTAAPSVPPSASPASAPSRPPSAAPSLTPSLPPSSRPTGAPTADPSGVPTAPPSRAPSGMPTVAPTSDPTRAPTAAPSVPPSSTPSRGPSGAPTAAPSSVPTADPSGVPTAPPSRRPSALPSAAPSAGPSAPPSKAPSGGPSWQPTAPPTGPPTAAPSWRPTGGPTAAPRGSPTSVPSRQPSRRPTPQPTAAPTGVPTGPPSTPPTASPWLIPTSPPIPAPTRIPTTSSGAPTAAPAGAPSHTPTRPPTAPPSGMPSVPPPTPAPLVDPTWHASAAPTVAPLPSPAASPFAAPSLVPTSSPSPVPSAKPTGAPRRTPSAAPSSGPSETSSAPSDAPRTSPSSAPSTSPSQPALPSTSPVYPAAPTASPIAALQIVPLPAQGPTFDGAAGVSVAAAVVGRVGAGTGAGRVAVIARVSCKPMEDFDVEGAEPLDWEFHPTGVPIGSHGARYLVGAVVLNPLLVFGCVLVLLLASRTQQFWCEPDKDKAMANLRAPGLVYLPAMLLLQGTSLAAARVLSNTKSSVPGDAVALCAVVAASCCAFPVVLWQQLLRAQKFIGIRVPDPRLSREGQALALAFSPPDKIPKVLSGWRRSAYEFAFGTETWVSADVQRPLWVDHWGVVFEPFREGHQAFALAEICVMLALSALSAWQTDSPGQCDVRNFLLLLVLLVYLAAMVWRRPYASRLDNILGVLMALLLTVAVLLNAIGVLLRSGSGATGMFRAAGVLLYAETVVVACKALWDVVIYGLDMSLGRRRGAQLAAVAAAASGETLSLFRAGDGETAAAADTAGRMRRTPMLPPGAPPPPPVRDNRRRRSAGLPPRSLTEPSSGIVIHCQVQDSLPPASKTGSFGQSARRDVAASPRMRRVRGPAAAVVEMRPARPLPRENRVHV